MNTLSLLIQSKKANPGLSHDVVTEAAEWLQTQLRTAEIDFSFADCEREFCGYALFQFHRVWHQTAITLYVKIAEIHATPYLFADIRVRDRAEQVLFPFFGEIGSDEGKEIALNYIADFHLSVEVRGEG
ncbi:MAG: hypothetical protein ACQKBV_08790 [Puniceicoccales bacterium]